MDTKTLFEIEQRIIKMGFKDAYVATEFSGISWWLDAYVIRKNGQTQQDDLYYADDIIVTIKNDYHSVIPTNFDVAVEWRNKNRHN